MTLRRRHARPPMVTSPMPSSASVPGLGAPGTGFTTAVRGGAGRNGLPLKLYSAKISNEPLTSNVIGGTNVVGRIVVEPGPGIRRISLHLEGVAVEATRKAKISELRCEGSERVHARLTSDVQEVRGTGQRQVSKKGSRGTAVICKNIGRIVSTYLH